MCNWESSTMASTCKCIFYTALEIPLVMENSKIKGVEVIGGLGVCSGKGRGYGQ